MCKDTWTQHRDIYYVPVKLSCQGDCYKYYIHLLINTLSLSRIPRDSLKHFEILVPRHIRVERERKTIN